MSDCRVPVMEATVSRTALALSCFNIRERERGSKGGCGSRQQQGHRMLAVGTISVYKRVKCGSSAWLPLFFDISMGYCCSLAHSLNIIGYLSIKFGQAVPYL